MRVNEIKEIIKNEVTEAWKRLCLYSDIYGTDDSLTEGARERWYGLDNLWCKLYDEEY